METNERTYERTNTASPRVDPPVDPQGGSTENTTKCTKHGMWQYGKFSVDPPGGSTLGEAVFVRTFVRTSPLTLFIYNSGSE